MQERKVGDAMKDRTTAGVLGIILGTLGAHHFYLGDTRKGVIYLVVALTGVLTVVPFVLGIVDGIGYLRMTDQGFADKYSGGVVANPSGGSSGGSLDRLERLNALREKGAISQDEYESKKAELLRDV